jgi:DNA (cytosine-5)-methyltransferase 1
MLTHVDLFSGILGFALAAKWAGFRTIAFCEKDEYRQKQIRKRWPSIPIVSEIRNFHWPITDSSVKRLYPEKNKQKMEEKGRQKLLSFKSRITLLTGGFPCQPVSVAGKRRGKEDDRWLWPEMLRVISEVRPTWIIAENVAGIVKLALDDCLSDLEGEGYEAEPYIIPACAVNAPHRRNRVWIIGYSSGLGLSGKHGRKSREKFANRFKNAENSSSNGLQGRIDEEKGLKKKALRLFSSRPIIDASDSKRILSQGFNERQEQGEFGRKSWEQNWLEVATLFGGMDDGIPVRMDGFELSKSRHRVERLKALGDAIVPQIAYEIIKRIAWIEKNEQRLNDG